MAGSLNRAMLIGHLGRDPEIRHTQGGDKIATFSIATSESWRDRQSGERVEKTEWHRVVVFNDRLADVAEKYLRKGAKVYVEGEIRTRKWTGNDNAERYTTEIVLSKFRGEIQMLDRREGPGAAGSEADHGTTRDAAPAPSTGGLPTSRRNPADDLDDEIPF